MLVQGEVSGEDARWPVYKPMPEIQESAEELRALMKQECHLKARQRLHARYGVASEQAHSRSAVACLPGVNRDTIGSWFALYAEGGRERLLDLDVSPGKASRVPPTVLQALVKRLEAEAGCASYGEIQTWRAEQHGVQLQYAAVHALVDHEDVTLVMATHDPAAIDFAAAVYDLRDGRIVERRA